MNIETIQSVYFVGAGGIGMSALVRYFLSKGKVVAGYDRTPRFITKKISILSRMPVKTRPRHWSF